MTARDANGDGQLAGAGVVGLTGFAYPRIEEETGYRIQHVEKVFEAFISPSSVTEKLFFFIADDDDSLKTDKGGGLEDEGEDIEVLELPLSEALEMMRTGEIVDGKTIMLLQHAELRLVAISAATKKG